MDSDEDDLDYPSVLCNTCSLTPQNLPAEYLCVSCMPWSYAYVMADSVLYSVYTCTVLVAWYSILYMPRSQYLHVHFFIICALFALELESLHTNTAIILI